MNDDHNDTRANAADDPFVRERGVCRSGSGGRGRGFFGHVVASLEWGMLTLVA